MTRILKLWSLTLFMLGFMVQLSLAANQPVEIGSLLQKPDMKELVYKTVGELKLHIFCLKPESFKAGEKRTAVIWIHGGGWNSGGADAFFPHARYFAARGAIAFSIDYRLLKADGSSTLANCVADCKSAIRYIRLHAEELGVDPNKIIVMGDSAGGHLASCLGTVRGFDDPADNLKISATPNAMVLYNPLSDFTTSPFIKLIIGGAAMDKKPTPESLIPNLAQLELAKKLSPLFNVHSNLPPTLVLHGMDDKVILPEQSISFSQAMKKAGNTCELILLPNTLHAFVCTHYKASEEEVVAAIRAADKFLIDLKFLSGEPSLVVSQQPAWVPKGKVK